MPKLVILGTSHAIPDKTHENTHMVLVGGSRTILIDCVGNQILRLEEAGVDVHSLTDLLLTHFHPDHASGVPQLLMNMWLMGHSRPLRLHGLDYTLQRVKALMDLYGWADWPNFFPVTMHPIPSEEMVEVIADEDLCLFTSPVQHMIPAIGMRFEFHPGKKVLAYSCDTEPCDQVVRLAKDADILIHEASGRLFGHSSAEQAGEVARRAGVKQLLLIHYQTGSPALAELVQEAKSTFGGPVALAEDLMVLDL